MEVVMYNVFKGPSEPKQLKAPKPKTDHVPKTDHASKTTPFTQGDYKEISELAYKFYIDRGGHHGHDKEDWYRAETIVRNKKTTKKSS